MTDYVLNVTSLGNANATNYLYNTVLYRYIAPLIQGNADGDSTPGVLYDSTRLEMKYYDKTGTSQDVANTAVPHNSVIGGQGYSYGPATNVTRARVVLPSVFTHKGTRSNLYESKWAQDDGDDTLTIHWNRGYYFRTAGTAQYIEFWQDKLEELFTSDNITIDTTTSSGNILVGFPARGLEEADVVYLRSAVLDGTELLAAPALIIKDAVNVTVPNSSSLTGDLVLTFTHLPLSSALDKVVITKTISSSSAPSPSNPPVSPPVSPVDAPTTLIPSFTDLRYVTADTKFQIKCILTGEYAGKTFEKLELIYALVSNQSSTTTLEYLTKADDDWYDISIADDTTIIITPTLTLSDSYEVSGTPVIVTRSGTTASFVTTDDVLDILKRTSVILTALSDTECQIALQHPFLFKSEVKNASLLFAGGGSNHTFTKTNPANSSTIRVDCTGLTANTEYTVSPGFTVGGVTVYGNTVKIKTAIELGSSPTDAKRKSYNIDRSIKMLVEPELLSAVEGYSETDKQDIIKQALSLHSAGTTLPIYKDRNPLNQSWEITRASTETDFSKKASQIEDSLLGFITGNIPDIDEDLSSY